MEIFGSLLSAFSPLIIWFIKLFVRKAEKRAKSIQNFYEFIASVDKQSSDKVANYIAAEKSLEDVQRMIREKELEEPERDSASIQKKDYEVPEIIKVDAHVKTHGKYLTKNKKARGLVVHFTAGRFEKGAKSAKSTVEYLASKGLGCLVMDTDGKIYRAENQMLDDIAWHSGKSAWLGHTGISRYCIGMEICNAGKLTEKGGSQYPWWAFNKDGSLKKGVPPIPKADQRHIASKRSNQKSGNYHKYTPAQEEALINFCLWQLDTNPDFDLDWIVGHDEIAPSRKSDPGGSLSMTMPDFREHLKRLMQ